MSGPASERPRDDGGEPPIYLDNHATTRVDPRVVAAMLPWFETDYGNAASTSHVFGRRAADAVERSRADLAAAVGAHPSEVVFTSGATESDNTALAGVARAMRERGDHIVTVVTEHKAVLDTCSQLEREGFRVTRLPVDGDGLVDPADVAAAVEARTILVAVMAVNNETGVVQPFAEIGAICRERDVRYLCDAAQAVGRIPVDVEAQQIDLLAFTAHKLYGPKGIGCLVVRRANPKVVLEPLIHGGGHERGMRSGTLSVPLIVGFATATRLAVAEIDDEIARIGALRERLWLGLNGRIEAIHLNGHPERRVAGNLNIAIDGIEAGDLLVSLPGLAASPGAACNSASPKPSYVLAAMGLDLRRCFASVRFGIGRFTTEAEIDRTIVLVSEMVASLRARSPLWEMKKQGVDISQIRW